MKHTDTPPAQAAPRGAAVSELALYAKREAHPSWGGLLFWNKKKGDSKGAGVNDIPVACQSRDPARPAAGESPLEHHQQDLYCLPGQKRFSC